MTIDGEQCLLAVMFDITERQQTEAELLVAIETVMQDTSWFGQKIVELTPRLRAVLEMTAQGMSDDGIGTKLGTSRYIICNHVSVICRGRHAPGQRGGRVGARSWL